MSFALKMPKLCLMGVGAIEDAVNELSQQGIEKVLLVTDHTLTELGIVDPVINALKNNKINYSLFDQVTPNPTVTLVNQGLEQYQQEQCKGFVAVGGGSPIDCAKAIRIMSTNPGSITDYEGVNQVKNTGAYFVAVNTTAGTAAEMTSNSVITDENAQKKMVIIDDKQIPDIAVNDPTLMLGLPASVTASTGMDALTHAIEAYVSAGQHTLTDPTALEAIRLIHQWLPIAVKDGKNLEARDKLACAEYLAGMAFNSAGLGLVHAMAHQPGATHNLAHGVCNAILLPIVSEYNAQYVPERFCNVAAALGGNVTNLSAAEGAQQCINMIRSLSSQVGIPHGFSELGIKEQDIPQWIDKALADPCLGCNPHQPTADEVYHLYSEAL
ncbi:lactaldehyde reductase [Vibrio nitrifigilis]|uniref:Lactaldehyde reductase n=1 Tax=Vibrio nitrifigilis TaxID=2789781 RepID=A0ABS0GCB0_9VIBR|nr:lactaldehyde reductase [Vibrio nitrifigilis]MBF9000041.1 lactaldehyde reductase [Vibrio nitrifigilis]